MTTTMRKDSIIQSWEQIIGGAAGHTKWVYEKTIENLKHANIPSMTYKLDDVTTDMFGIKREFLILYNQMLRDYRMFIGVRDYGAHLDASWFVTLMPRGLKRALSKYTTGNPYAFSQQMDMFNQQDLNAWVSVSNEMFQLALKDLAEEVKFDPSILNKQSRGYLNVW